MAAMESAAMIVVLRCHRRDGEYHDRPGDSPSVSFGSARFSLPLADGCFDVVFID
jgi:hypothetical protein